MTDQPEPIYDDDTDDRDDARRYLSGSCWAGNHGECTDPACEDNCGHEAAQP